jgi:hypothetical protein
MAWPATSYDAGLSPEQARFAEEHDARPGIHGADAYRMVFLYHDNPAATYRWLVDSRGRPVDAEVFHKSLRL